MSYCGVLPAHAWHRVPAGVCPGTTVEDEQRTAAARAAFAAGEPTDRDYLREVCRRSYAVIPDDYVRRLLAGLEP